MSHTHDYNTYKVSKGPADGEPVDVLGDAGQTKTSGTFADYVSDNETRPVNIAVNFIIRAV
jgi:hypothetical protein